MRVIITSFIELDINVKKLKKQNQYLERLFLCTFLSELRIFWDLKKTKKPGPSILIQTAVIKNDNRLRDNNHIKDNKLKDLKDKISAHKQVDPVNLSVTKISFIMSI